ncbi:MAG: hypothetical protein HC831_09660 [Chloroflexia bacterium]|nr:hypothetical protein [Chloroflexia bacterium]
MVALFLHFVMIIGQEQDSVNYRYEGLRIGADVGNYLINSATGERNELMILADYEFVQDRYAVLEGGYSLIDDVNDSLVNKINGAFGIVGIDFNFYDRKRRINDDILYLGLRYAYSTFAHDFSRNETYTGSFSEEGKDNYSAQWGEFVLGGKGELWFLKNVFLGLSLRVKVLTTKTEAELIEPSRIPGFGNYSKGVVVGLNWTISYRIPFKKIKVIPTKKKDKKKKDKQDGN